MRNGAFTIVFVTIAVQVGWWWHVAQVHHVPFWVRVPLGMAIIFALGIWLQRRLRLARTTTGS